MSTIFSSNIQLKKPLSQKNFKKWDSLNHVRIFIEIEKKFGIKFSNDEVNKTNNSDQILKMIEFKKKLNKMIFSSYHFLILYPYILLSYYLYTNKNYQNFILIAFSVYFISYLHYKHFLVFVFFF